MDGVRLVGEGLAGERRRSSRRTRRVELGASGRHEAAALAEGCCWCWSEWRKGET